MENAATRRSARCAMTDGTVSWGTEKISKILLKLAPPVMLAQLIQALYNIVDSLFVGMYSESGLTALSIVYPLQLLMIALAVGTGVGINTVVAARLGVGDKKGADECAGVAAPLATALWLAFALACYFLMPLYADVSTDSETVAADVIVYGRIVCVFSFGLFEESVWTKVMQANGNMKTPMIAQIAGAVVNIALDPLLIFGPLFFPEAGIAGAAIATVAGQVVAALVVMRGGIRRPPPVRTVPRYVASVFRMGLPNILMQSAYTLYIFGLNLILATFSDQAVTALGLYYKWQTFFFIPLGAMQTCIVPVISYNYAAHDLARCRSTVRESMLFGLVLMAVGTLCFLAIPAQMLGVFTRDPEVIRIGTVGFRYIGVSFLPMVASLLFPRVFPGGGVGGQEFAAHGHPHRRAVRATWLSVLARGAGPVLADVPRHRIHNRRGGRGDVLPLFQKTPRVRPARAPRRLARSDIERIARTPRTTAVALPSISEISEKARHGCPWRAFCTKHNSIA